MQKEHTDLHFLIVGFVSKKIHVKSAMESGIKLSLIINKSEYKKEYEDIFLQILMVDDIYNWEQLRRAVDGINQKIDGVLTKHEDYVNVVGAINQYLGLKGIDYATARSFCNKYLMKQKWLKAGVACAEGICLDNLNKLDEFLQEHSFPLILKKTSSVHSNFVVKVNSKEDLLEKIKFLKSQVSNRVTSKPVVGYESEKNECSLLLEEMLEGRELTVDTFVSNGRFVHTPICEYTMANELNVDDSYLPIRTMPTGLSQNQERIIYESVEKALSALSANGCVCHTELFLDDKNNTCKLIETTPRGGGNRTEMTFLATGYDYSLAVFKATANLEIESPQIPKSGVSVVEYFAEKKGILEDIDLDFLYNLSDVSRIVLTSKVGDFVEQAKFGGKVIVSFFVEKKNYLESQELAKFLFRKIQQSVRIN